MVAAGVWWVSSVRADRESEEAWRRPNLSEHWWWCPTNGGMCTSEPREALGELPEQRPKSWGAYQCFRHLPADEACERTPLVFCRSRRVDGESGCYRTKRECELANNTDGNLPCMAFVDGWATY